MRAALANTWTDFWSERTTREKSLLMAGGAVLGIVILYGILWAPAIEGRARLLGQMPAMQRQLAEMTAQANEARALSTRAQSAAPTGNTLKNALADSLRQQGISGAQVLIAGNAVQIRAKSVSFSNWVAWLDQVRKQYRVQIVETHATALKEDGQVDLTATLQPPDAR
jgi:general secretion pathway protein M